ncbi:EamA family transporter [Rhizobium sp. BK418]|uniref:EamA family transporter n=1 Tax=Rhizobium sp. BK418 TaxID=2512120 RepID=UPI00105255F2|nr:EamA family transporter [Rhizobium sp. BK418]TCR96253.1 EamA-like transporter family protein [Rhizobium sp. BK418]
MTLSRPYIAIAAAFAAIYLIWGSTYLALALGLQTLPPFLLMSARCLVGGTILYGYARMRGAALPSTKMCSIAIMCGLLFFVGCHGVLAEAQQRVPSGVAALLLATIPLWIALLQFLIPGGKRPTGVAGALLVPGVAGVALIAWQEVTSGGNTMHPVDVILLLGASLSWAVGTILSERYSSEFASTALAGLELLAGGVALLAISAVSGELGTLKWTEISAVSLGGWAYLTFIGTVIAFSAYIWLLKRVAPALVATYTFVNPIIAVALGWAFLGERPTSLILVGAVMIIASVAGLLLSGAKSAKNDKLSSSGEPQLSSCRNDEGHAGI